MLILDVEAQVKHFFYVLKSAFTLNGLMVLSKLMSISGYSLQPDSHASIVYYCFSFFHHEEAIDSSIL